MNPVYSRLSVLSVVLAASVLGACSAEDGGSKSSAPPSGQEASASSDGDPTSSAPSQPPSTPPASTARGNSKSTNESDSTTPPSATEAPTQLLSIVSGSVTSSGNGSPANGLGGLGTLAAASSVQLLKLVDGVLELVGQGSIDALGNYSVEVPLGLDTLIAQVVDATGHVLGSVIIGSSGAVGAKNVIAAPITTETSLEAAIFLGTSSSPLASASVDALSLALDVSALVDPQLTDAVNAAIVAGADPATLVSALSTAVIAFARARSDALVAAGVTIDADAATQAELDALQHLGSGLSDVLARNGTVSDVTATLLNDLRATLSAATHAAPSINVRAQVAGSVAFSAILSPSLSSVPNGDAIGFAVTRTLSAIQANVIAGAVKSILESAGAGQELVEAAVAAGNKLIADVAAATNLAALQQARLDFLSAILGGVGGNNAGGALLDVLPGSGGTSGGLLGNLLAQTTTTVDALLDPVLDRVTTLTQSLETSLGKKVSGVTQGNGSTQLDSTLALIIQSLTKFAADVEALGPSLASGNAGQVPTAALTDLIATTQVLLRGLVP